MEQSAAFSLKAGALAGDGHILARAAEGDDQAEQLLNGIAQEERGAEWFYLRACVYVLRGWIYEAHTSAGTACSLDPDNEEYRQLYDTIEANINRADGTYRTTSDSSECDICSICQTLACLNCMCRMCCR